MEESIYSVWELKTELIGQLFHKNPVAPVSYYTYKTCYQV